MRGHGQVAVLALSLQPFGQWLLAMLQQQLCGRHQAAQARCQATQLRIQLGAQHGLRRVVFGDGFHIHTQRLQRLGQAIRLRMDLRHRLMQCIRQHAVGKAQRAVVAFAARVLAGVGPYQVHGQAGQRGQRAFELAGHGLHVFAHMQCQLAGHLVHGLGQLVQPAQIAQVHGVGELVQRDGGQVVAFVKHHQAVVQVGQGLHAQAGQHQVVVGHDDIGLGQLGARVVVAAFLVARAVARGAGVALGGHGRPVARVGGVGQGVAVAVPTHHGQLVRHALVERLAAFFDGLLRQCRHLGLRPVVVKHIVFGRAAAHQAFQLHLADVAPAALGQRVGKGLVHAARQGGQVLGHQLLLQGYGGGADDDARLAFQRHGNGGRGIGCALAHAGTSLDDGNGLGGVGVLANIGLGQRGGHGFGHLVLAGAAPKATGAAHHGLEGVQGVLGQGGAGGRQGGKVGQTGGPSARGRAEYTGSRDNRACATPGYFVLRRTRRLFIHPEISV